MNDLISTAKQTMIELYSLQQPTDDFLFYIYNHPEAPFKDAYLNQEIVCLMSGGIDSVIGYYVAKQKFKNVRAVYVDYGYKYSEVEKATILSLGIDCIVYDFSEIKQYQIEGEKYWGEIFPGRNWLLCTIAGSLFHTRGEIWIMAISGEVKKKWGDKTELLFSEGSKRLSQYYRCAIEIRAPFSNFTKGRLIQYFLSLGGDVNYLKKTVSCHEITKIGQIPCGKCMGCCHRYIGMKFNNIDEEYDSDVHLNATMLYRDAINDPFSGFNADRINEIKTVLKL